MASPSRALVVDDDPGVVRTFLRFFQWLGWEADAAGDGAAAVQAFRPGAYQVVVCDVNLGEEDGIAVARVLRDIEPSLRVIIASGLPENIERARAAGFENCLRKPFTPAELKAVVGAGEAPPLAQDASVS